MELEVQHNADAQRFEIELEGHLAVLEYQLPGDGRVVFTHTGVPKELEGRGIGSRLARAALDWARTAGYRVVALCWFVNGWIDRHPEYQDLRD